MVGRYQCNFMATKNFLWNQQLEIAMSGCATAPAHRLKRVFLCSQSVIEEPILSLRDRLSLPREYRRTADAHKSAGRFQTKP